jgi:hypothetical protein
MPLTRSRILGPDARQVASSHFSNKCAGHNANGTALSTVTTQVSNGNDNNDPLPTRDANGVDGDGEDVNLARIEVVGDDRDGSYIDEFNFQSFEENSSNSIQHRAGSTKGGGSC